MIPAKAFVETAKMAGFSLYSGVPCSYVKPFINYVIDAPDLAYIGAANEGDHAPKIAPAQAAVTRMGAPSITTITLAIRTVENRCDTSTVMRPSARPATAAAA